MLYNGRLLGEIAIFRNLVFNNGLADHASINGRPCLILSDIDDKLYIIPLSHSKANFLDDNYYYHIPKNKLIKNPYRPYDNRQQFLSFTDIIELDIFGIRPICNISEKEYYKVIKKLLILDFKEQQKTYDNFMKIKDDLENQKNILAKKLEKCHNSN